MKSFIWAACFISLLGCDQRRRVGDVTPRQPDPSTMLGEVQIQNLVARVTDRFQCPAGRLSDVDDSQSCSCNQSPFECEQGGGFPVPCTCDPGCYDSRPQIDCASYELTFAIKNAGTKTIERMTEVRLTIGELELFEGGLNCDADSWTLAPGETGGVVEIGMETFDYAARYAYPALSYPCYSGGPIPKNGNPPDQAPDALGEPMPPALTSGAVMIEVRGLYTDASPWKIEASADLD